MMVFETITLCDREGAVMQRYFYREDFSYTFTLRRFDVNIFDFLLYDE